MKNEIIAANLTGFEILDSLSFAAALVNSDFEIIALNNHFSEIFQLRENSAAIFDLLQITENEIKILRSGQSISIVTNSIEFEISPVKNNFFIKQKNYHGEFLSKIQHLENSLSLSKTFEAFAGEILKTGFDFAGLISDETEFEFQDRSKFICRKDDFNFEAGVKFFNLIEDHFADDFENNSYLKITYQSGDFESELLNSFSSKEILIKKLSLSNKISGYVICGKFENSVFKFQSEVFEKTLLMFEFTAENILEKKINSELAGKLLQAQKLETVGKLASGMAHDFNNLLSSIFGSLDLLKKKLSDCNDVKYLLENIESCSTRAADLSKGLLSYGKPTSKRKLPVRSFDLLNEIVSVFSQSIPENIKFNYQIESELPQFLGNSTEIYQVILNLCINSKEAIKDYGEIFLRAESLEISKSGKQNFPMLESGKYIKISVKDSGEGISKENLQNIFEPYFSTKKKETGGGLGLYMVYGIIKAHNGFIDVKSKPGEGTQFDVYLPVYFENAGVQIPASEKIIVLADDEIMLRDILAELLESSDYHVLCVQDGKEALQLLTEEIKADLLIIDMNMPVMDGLTCVKKLRESGGEIPVVLSSGNDTENIKDELNILKISAVLTKPYEFDFLFEEIKKII